MRIRNTSQETDREVGSDEFDFNSEAGSESAAKAAKHVEPPGFKIPKKVDISHAVSTVQDGQDVLGEEEEDVMEHDDENEFDDMVYGISRFSNIFL